MFQFLTHVELSRSMAAILEMPQYVAYQKNVAFAFMKLSAKSHSFNILCTMDGLSCPTMSLRRINLVHSNLGTSVWARLIISIHKYFVVCLDSGRQIGDRGLRNSDVLMGNKNNSICNHGNHCLCGIHIHWCLCSKYYFIKINGKKLLCIRQRKPWTPPPQGSTQIRRRDDVESWGVYFQGLVNLDLINFLTMWIFTLCDNRPGESWTNAVYISSENVLNTKIDCSKNVLLIVVLVEYKLKWMCC